MVFQAQLAKALQRRTRPDDADWILWIAQDHHRGQRIG
ncbi:hypothetical protein Nizo2776_0495 [Lactiplantibacillus plantarum]|nr:hypothetical protein Nizo2776_0495 [Lactiplantibacillus plantarum]